MITIKRQIKFTREARGRQRIVNPEAERTPIEAGRIPRISRLMALAIRLESMLRSGEVSDITELARISHVTQPRISQILGLTLLAPDIQEELLFLPRLISGKSAIHEKMLRPVVSEVDWGRQRAMWKVFSR